MSYDPEGEFGKIEAGEVISGRGFTVSRETIADFALGSLDFNPPESHVIQAGQTIILLGHGSDVTKLQQEFIGETD